MAPASGRRRRQAISRASTTSSARQVIGDRPAHDTATEGVDDDGEIDPALTGRVLGDVLDPQPVGAVGAELAVHEIV